MAKISKPYIKIITKLADRFSTDDDKMGIYKYIISLGFDEDVATKLMVLFLNYGDDVDQLSDLDIDIESEVSNYVDKDDHHLMALSRYLKVIPFLIERKKYDHYDMNQYSIEETGEEFAVGDEDERENSARENVESFYDEHGVDGYSKHFVDGVIDDVIDVDTYVASEFVTMEANNSVEGMDDDEIIEYIKDNDLNDSDELEKLETFKDQLESLDVVDDIDDEQSIDTLIDKIDRRISEIIEESKDEIRDQLEERIREEFDRDPIGYYQNVFGYSYKELIDYGYLRIDKENFIDEVIYSYHNNYGDLLGTYDGDENEQEYNGKTYYIYRTN